MVNNNNNKSIETGFDEAIGECWCYIKVYCFGLVKEERESGGKKKRSVEQKREK
jgi:hypothetical protein